MCPDFPKEIPVEGCQEGARSDRMSKLAEVSLTSRTGGLAVDQKPLLKSSVVLRRTDGAEFFLAYAGLGFTQRSLSDSFFPRFGLTSREFHTLRVLGQRKDRFHRPKAALSHGGN